MIFNQVYLHNIKSIHELRIVTNDQPLNWIFTIQLFSHLSRQFDTDCTIIMPNRVILRVKDTHVHIVNCQIVNNT